MTIHFHFARLSILSLLTAFATLAAFAPQGVASLSEPRFIENVASSSCVALVDHNSSAPILIDHADWPGAIRAVADLQSDIERVTQHKPEVNPAAPSPIPQAIIVGTIGRSKFIDALIAAGRIDVSTTRGRWEAFLIQTVEKPLPGIDRALVIAGSDKRGTIYGIYEVSEQIGVSPWYWWADVPVVHQDAIFARAGTRITDAPVVKYRGIFINDEAPSFSGWAQEKFGGANHTMYAHMFELILRLRGNYLWPAMWKPRAFFDDDPENGRLADEYGIVMGTSHHEPMMRAHAEWDRYGKGPWDYSKNEAVLREFWRGGVERAKNFDKIITVGMRGDGDSAMSAETNTALLERIVADQREIISDVIKRPLPEIPQLWALYKEVQGYYENGMRVPDDVTLLWCDDNWGNIRRLPTPGERTRSGGAGVYYHFDYVGGPRNYKWINVTPLTKVWEQMHLAWQTRADRIWIVNVGDLKPMEFPIEFFLTYAWNPARWPYEKLDAYSQAWAAREFGEAHAAEVAHLISGYTKLNRRRTPEMMAPDTFSLVNYDEAGRIVAEWNDLVARAEKLNAELAPRYRDAFFQLVLYPVKASAGVQEINIAAGLNKLYAVQGRTATNSEAARVRELFAEDAALTKTYHTLNGGKWDHQMDQIKLGYTYWQTPPAEVMPAVAEVRPNPGAVPAIALEGNERGVPLRGATRLAVPSIDRSRENSRWVEIYNRGDTSFTFTAASDQSWLRVTPASGSVDETTRLEISADWSTVPAGATSAVLKIATSAGQSFTVDVPLANLAPAPGSPTGTFVETDGCIAIEAPHFARAINAGEIEWKTLADFGRTLGGVTAFPVLAAEVGKPGGASPHLEYNLQFSTTGAFTTEFQLAPSLDFQSGDGLRFAVSLDDAGPQVLKLDTWQTLQTWEKAVGENIRKVSLKLPVSTPGHHVLKFWYVTPGVVLERIIVDTGGLKPSYLGPQESPRTR